MSPARGRAGVDTGIPMPADRPELPVHRWLDHVGPTEVAPKPDSDTMVGRRSQKCPTVPCHTWAASGRGLCQS
jgi:hypothetical protein